jgi:hypothetical protein
VAGAAVLTHGNLVSNAMPLIEAWRCADPGAADLHTHGLFVATNVTLFSGASMLFLPRFAGLSGSRRRASPRRAAVRRPIGITPARFTPA